MTVTNIPRRVALSGDGVSTVFPVTFQFFEISVFVDGVFKNIGSDYVIEQDAPGLKGSIVFSEPPEDGASVVIDGTTEIVQEADYVEGDDFPAETHEQVLDRLTMAVQELRQDYDQTPSVPGVVGDVASAARLGSYVVTVYGGKTYMVPSNLFLAAGNDPTGIGRAHNVGDVIYHALGEVPPGWIRIRKSVQFVSKSEYPEWNVKCAAEGYPYGSTATHVGVPGGAGLFVRAWDDVEEASLDPDAAVRTNEEGVIVGNVIGSRQSSANKQHNHGPGNLAGSTGLAGDHYHYGVAGYNATDEDAPSGNNQIAQRRNIGGSDNYILAGTNVAATRGRTSSAQKHSHSVAVSNGATGLSGNLSEARPSNIALPLIMLLRPGDAAGSHSTLGLPYVFSSEISGESVAPGSIRFDHTESAEATTVRVSKTTSFGADVTAVFDGFNQFSAESRGVITIYNAGQLANSAVFSVTGSVAEEGEHLVIPVTRLSGLGTFVNNAPVSLVPLFSGPASTEPGPPGPPGDIGPPGGQGDTGPAGPNTGLDYLWSGSVSGDPGSGYVSADNADIGSAAKLFVSAADRNGADKGAYVATWAASTSAEKGHIRLFALADPSKYIEAAVTGIIDQSTYWEVDLTVLAASEDAPGDDEIVSISFSRTGDAGDPEFAQPGTGAVTRTLESKARDIISVLDFIPTSYHADIRSGAVSDDLSEYVQAAVAYAATLRGSTAQLDGSGVAVFFPAGKYPILSPVEVAVHGIGFYGSPGKGTRIVGDNILFDVGVYTETTGTPRIFRTHFRDLNLVASNKSTTAAAVKLWRPTGTIFENVHFVDWNIGIDSYRSSETRVTGCRFINVTRTANATAHMRLQGTDETGYEVVNGIANSAYTPGGGWHVTDNECIGGQPVSGSYDTASVFDLRTVDGFYATQNHMMVYRNAVNINPAATPENHVIGDVMLSNNYFDEPSHLDTARQLNLQGSVKQTITMADATTRYSTYQSVRAVNNYFRGSYQVDRNIRINIQDGDSWYSSVARKLKDIVITGNTIRQSTFCGVEAVGASANRIECHDLTITGNNFEEHNQSGSNVSGAAITVQAESCTITGNTVGPHAGTSNYAIFVTASDAGNDSASPSAIISGNNCARTANAIAPARVFFGSAASLQASVQSGNLAPGAGFTLDDSYKLTTTDATTASIWEWLILDGVSGYANVRLTGSSNTGKHIVYEWRIGFKRATTSALSSGNSAWTSLLSWNPDSIATPPTADLSSNTLRVRVTGVSAETWTWQAHVHLVSSK